LAKVLTEILASFFTKLSESEAVDARTIAELQALFQSDKKLRADDVVAVISGATGKRTQ